MKRFMQIFYEVFMYEVIREARLKRFIS